MYHETDFTFKNFRELLWKQSFKTYKKKTIVQYYHSLLNIKAC